MEAQSLTDPFFAIENPCIDQMALVLPADGVPDFRARLDDSRNPAMQEHSPARELIQLLQLFGWNAVEQRKGEIALIEYTGRKLDLMHDIVLVSAAGIVKPGSFVLGHSEHESGPSWWVSYTAQEKQINQGIPTKEQVDGLMVCPECGSLNPGEWHHIQYTAIRYPVKSVNTVHIVTASEGEALYECVIKDYFECSCGAELARDGKSVF